MDQSNALFGRRVMLRGLTLSDFEAWRELASQSAYASFLDEVPNGQELLDLAFEVE